MTLKEVRNLVDKMPFNQLLGIRVARLHKDGVTIQCTLREELRNSAGVLHGGVTATMADAAVGIALSRHFRGSRLATTVELKISYLRPISHGRIAARAHLLKIGGRLCVGRVDLFDDGGKLAASALVTYLLLEGTS
ncbi:MAG: PaaI family thioesterase [Acidobacteriota bacterium]|nr:PaaI family thioesterase [Acidobacteriota bacterium]